MQRPRPAAARSAAIALAALALGTAAGCTGEFGQQFRDAAGPQLETGINALLDGIVQGAFAVYEPDEDTTDEDQTGGT
jgi:hypothetical protein